MIGSLEKLYTSVFSYLTELRGARLYFHSPCFDGVASAVIASDFLESHQHWPSLQLYPVNYDRKKTWTHEAIGRKAAVVDFLYHPDAHFWVDHHPTTFGNQSPDAIGAERPFRLFNPDAPSCASLLAHALEQRFGYRNNLFEPLVQWAIKIDSARYDSVHEAVVGDAPALRINLAFQVAGDDYPKELVRALRTSSLDAVAAMPSTDAKFCAARSLLDDGLQRFRRSAAMTDDGIVTFDLSKDGIVFNRYAPYYFFPDALYSAGITRSNGRLTITAMRNPWKDFETVSLGRIFEAFGGGGHQRVGSVSFTGDDGEPRALEALDAIVASLRAFLSARTEERARAAHAW